MGYSPAGDLVQAIGDAAGAKARELQSRREARDAEQLNEAVSKLREDNAANLAEKYALRAALAKLDPDHPLVVNAALRERIHQAGIRAIALTNDWEAAREAGETFRY
ncbi:hypothetical protein [Ramlibacter sp. AN1133]|uniref:hypothetical protein n=1 Tax=Ramlibacter sp. AN1133 TaxID=3133429 RepID=UPI0030C317CE